MPLAFPKPLNFLKSLDFLKPGGLAYPLPVVVTTGRRPPMSCQARRADTPKGR